MNATNESNVDLVGPGPWAIGPVIGAKVGPTVDGKIAITFQFPPNPGVQSSIEISVDMSEPIAAALLAALEVVRRVRGWPLPSTPIAPKPDRKH
jgi:hypothetical protein